MILLIDESVARELAAARARVLTFSQDQIKAFEDGFFGVAADRSPRNITRAGSTMEVLVEGVLTEKPDLWAAWFGGGNTTYDSIVQALASARTDDTVKEVVLRVNSPGGTVDGLFDALGAIEGFRADSGKKLRVIASKAQSAAFAIASAAGPIQAKNAGSMFGSIGTAIDFSMWSGMKTISITNTESPDKRPNPETEEGRAVITRQLDALNEIFVDAIARGRGTTVEDVTKNYGRGASFVAAEAKRLGMIDSLPKAPARSSSSGRTKAESERADVGEQERETMDLDQLKAQHPDVFKAAVAEGVASERDRVVAHLVMGEAFGALPTAVAAVKEGRPMTESLRSEYMAASANRRDIAARQADSNAAAAATAGTSAAPANKDLGDMVAEHLFGAE